MFRRLQRAVAALTMVALTLIPQPAGSQTAVPAASPEGQSYEVFLFTPSSAVLRDCWSFDASGSFSSQLLGSGSWGAVPFGTEVALWFGNASLGDVAVSEMVGLSFPATGAALSGLSA
jgi:hypothetical protein